MKHYNETGKGATKLNPLPVFCVKEVVKMSETTEKKREIEISIKELSMTFKDNSGNDVKALTNVNLDIYKGEFISLLGPSGCGKTTLLRMVADLLEPTEGQVRISGMTPKEIRLQRKLKEVLQQTPIFSIIR